MGGTTLEEADNAASSKWLVDFSKPCPKCRCVFVCMRVGVFHLVVWVDAVWVEVVWVEAVWVEEYLLTLSELHLEIEGWGAK